MSFPYRRSVLFCPGSRPGRFAKALTSGADAVCLDLEDGVAPDERELARREVVRFLARWGWGEEGARAGEQSGREAPAPASGELLGGSEAEADGRFGAGSGARPGARAGARGRPEVPELMVRVNDPRTRTGQEDLEALAGVRRADALIVPKADGPEVLEELVRTLGGAEPGGGAGGAPPLLPLIETALGLHRAEEVATAGLPLGALVFGGMDLAAELGARLEWEALLYARSRTVHAAALAGVGAIDVPWAALDNAAGLEAETRRAARLGFTGKLAIHPGQIPAIHRGLAPHAGELDSARRIVEAAAQARGGVVVVDGRMVDRPVVLGARRILARAGEEWSDEGWAGWGGDAGGVGGSDR